MLPLSRLYIVGFLLGLLYDSEDGGVCSNQTARRYNPEDVVHFLPSHPYASEAFCTCSVGAWFCLPSFPAFAICK
jgi:hypothetical protein